MTAIPKDSRVSELREMFRFLVPLRTLHETDGIDEVTSSFGNTWSLWDLEYLYAQVDRLTDPQRRAITLCLVHGMLEREAALMMGVSESNPVGMYATLGLARLLEMIDQGKLDRFTHVPRCARLLAQEREEYLDNLASFVRSRVRLVPGTTCWSFPHAPGREPVVLVRSRTSPNGFLALHPGEVLYEHAHGPRPSGTTLVHDAEGPEDCINPRHTGLTLSEGERARLRARARSCSRRTSV